ncbi:MAG: LemA family protein [Intrasporangium sp.]|uniref:LemA family protein n=1 Tax=Intrasporangium sp. TaxID=1925024 RepID=UPI003F7E7EFD
MSESLAVVLAAAGGSLVVLVLFWFTTHNRLVHLRQHISESQRDVDVELKRRHDLVPRLVEVVRAAAGHERALIATLRAEQVPLSGPLALVAERSPQLRTADNFLALQHQLAETEDRLAAARRIHASNVERYNERVQRVPTSLVARAGGFTPAAYADLG